MEKIAKLIEIQQKLNAPKDMVNKFGGYNYRSCESILGALKPLLAEAKLALILHDDIVDIGGRVYVKATAKLIETDGSVAAECTAYAREEEKRGGMDAAQITGSTSSYARKYALNGLFAIDDTKDVDSTEYQQEAQTKTAQEGKKAMRQASGQQKTEKPAEQPKTANVKPVELTAEEQEVYTQLCSDLDIADSVASVLATCMMAEKQPYELAVRRKAAKRGIELATSAEEIHRAYDLIKGREGWEEIRSFAESTAKAKGFVKQ